MINGLYLGYLLLIPVMYMFMNMMNSFNQYTARDTNDIYLLCDRVDDLENDIIILKKLLELITNDLNNEYVETLRYNKDQLEVKDNITISKKDITKLEDEIKTLKQCFDKVPAG